MDDQDPPLPDDRVLLRLRIVADDLNPILYSESPHRPVVLQGETIELD